jgi:hypothetical protein
VQIHIPAPSCDVVRVRNIVPKLRTLAANIANLCHVFSKKDESAQGFRRKSQLLHRIQARRPENRSNSAIQAQAHRAHTLKDQFTGNLDPRQPQLPSPKVAESFASPVPVAQTWHGKAQRFNSILQQASDMPTMLEPDTVAASPGARTWKMTERRNQIALAVVVIVGLNLAFLLSFWNRFLGPGVSGMFLEFASRLLSGKVPYRDFYVVVTPFYIFKTAAIVKLFGPSLAVLRLVDIGYRCALGAILVIWLSKVVRIPYALIGALSAIAVFSTDPADPLISYHLEATFWAVSGAFLLSYVRWERREILRNLSLISCSGACCSVCFFTKQTEGGGITLALLTVIAGLSMHDLGLRPALLRLVAFCTGWILPAGAVLGWLTSKGALRAFAIAIFVDGPSAKGSPGHILTRVFIDGLGSWPGNAVYLLFAICTMCLVVRMVHQRGTELPSTASATIRITLIAVAGVVALLAGYAAGVFVPSSPVASYRLEIWSIYFSFFGVFSLAIYYSLMLFRHGTTESEKQRWLLVMAAFWISYTMSWSWVAWGPMAFPSLGVVIAFMLDGLLSRPRSAALRHSLAAVAVLFLLVSEAGRVSCPFSWDSWTDGPIWNSTAHSTQPMLHGIYMSPEMASFVDRLTTLIDDHSRVNDSIFIYSYQPLWYVLADRWPPTYAQVHFYDVAPDDLCRRDAERIVKERPAVIVDFVGDSDLWNEKLFRAGQKSGQRELQEQMYKLIAADYRLEAAIPVKESPVPVRVFVLRSQE